MAYNCNNSPLSGMHFVIRGLIRGRIYESRFHALAFRVVRNEFLCARRKETLSAGCTSKKCVLHSAICVTSSFFHRASLNSCRHIAYTCDTDTYDVERQEVRTRCVILRYTRYVWNTHEIICSERIFPQSATRDTVICREIFCFFFALMR